MIPVSLFLSLPLPFNLGVLLFSSIHMLPSSFSINCSLTHSQIRVSSSGRLLCVPALLPVYVVFFKEQRGCIPFSSFIVLSLLSLFSLCFPFFAPFFSNNVQDWNLSEVWSFNESLKLQCNGYIPVVGVRLQFQLVGGSHWNFNWPEVQFQWVEWSEVSVSQSVHWN